jgi:hypothetical protein
MSAEGTPGMSKPTRDYDKNPDAFPDDGAGTPGMTLRDYFAAKAMATILDYESARTRTEIDADVISASAYEIADTMLEARAK